MKPRAETALCVGNIVGESLIWDFRIGRFLWVVIIGKRIHACDADGGRAETWDTPGFVTSIGLAARGGYVVGLLREVVQWTPGGDFVPLAVPEPDLPDNRLNEGVVGPDGAFWIGTMQNNIAPDGSPRDITEATGALYRVTAAGVVHPISDRDFGITNTLIWDNGRLITADTMANALYAFDIAPGTGRLRNRRTILQGFDRGLPDGSAQDAEGAIWNCRVVGGSCLLRLQPDGAVLGCVELPVSWPTSCAFGGRDLDRLFVTSARFSMSAGHLASNPQEGALVRISGAGMGRPSYLFG